jgi:hypothetical protein
LAAGYLFHIGARPRIEFLWWEGCPSHPRALADLRAAARALGLDPDAIDVREVHTDEDAVRERFLGSPSIRVDGRELFPPGEDEPGGLTCRIYKLRDGRVSPTPDPADVLEALMAATKGG